jgi:Mce-associated membrane protein
MATDADAPAEALTAQESGADPTPAAEPQAPDASVDETEEHDAPIDDERGHSENALLQRMYANSPAKLAIAIGLVAVVALGALAGWLGFLAYQSHQTQAERELFVQVGRQGALNLTTIDWQHADTDVQRVLDSATGTFYDDFSKRSQPFIDVVKKAQSKSVGTITEAGLESESGNEAQVLVGVGVNTSNIGAVEQEPRFWRMRISVQKVGGEAKVSNVAFVP